MKKIIIFSNIIILSSCIVVQKSDVTVANMANNTAYKKKFNQSRAVLPIKNISYFENDDKDKMSQLTAKESREFYNNNIQKMSTIMESVVDDIDGQAENQFQDVTYVYDKKDREYKLDESYFDNHENISSNNLSSRYNINERMGYKTNIPIKNAYEIFKMKQSGYKPNKVYFDNMQSPKEEKRTVEYYYEFDTPYKKSSEDEILMMSGN
jgi:hypothetical protein